ncbi:MAG: hypothetical protein JF606_29185 [Burkholderiales bacterium]|nr:hypothetical protein [Burkholderiales bacterium]
MFMRSRRADRVGKTPKQLLTGQAHAHWLELLGFEQSLAGLTSAPTDAPQVLLNPSTIRARRRGSRPQRARLCYPEMAETEPRRN